MKRLAILLLVMSFLLNGVTEAHETSVPHDEIVDLHFDVSEADGKLIARALINSESRVNAFDLEIGFSESVLELVAFEIKNSVVDFWKDGPRLGDKKSFRILGGSVKGFAGIHGELITLYFDIKQAGQARFYFNKSKAYYADGKGTLASVKTPEFRKTVKPRSITEATKAVASAPSIGELGIVKNPADNSRLVVWQFDNKISDLQKTEVRFLKWFAWSGWSPGSSPVKIPDEAWGVEVKAVNLSGNIASKVVYSVPIFIKEIFLYGIGILSCMAAGHLIFRRKFSARN